MSNASTCTRKMDYRFAPEHFARWVMRLAREKHPKGYISPVRTWSLAGRGADNDDLERLIDHGFIAEGAPTWGALAGMPEGHEFAIIARTYATDAVIDNPPEGLRCFRLPPATMGRDDPGTAIAIVIESMTPSALSFISLFSELPARLLPYVLPLHVGDTGRLVILPDGWGAELRVRFVSHEALVLAGVDYL